MFATTMKCTSKRKECRHKILRRRRRLKNRGRNIITMTGPCTKIGQRTQKYFLLVLQQRRTESEEQHPYRIRGRQSPEYESVRVHGGMDTGAYCWKFEKPARLCVSECYRGWWGGVRWRGELTSGAEVNLADMRIQGNIDFTLNMILLIHGCKQLMSCQNTDRGIEHTGQWWSEGDREAVKLPPPHTYARASYMIC